MSKWKWIAQDAEGRVCKFLEKVVPVNGYLFWEKYPEKYKVVQEHGERNPNWKDTLINLETEDYEIVDGILKRLPRKTKLDELIARVKLIDKKAAKWINKNRHLCKDTNEIDGAFYWYGTPQEWEYWSRINDKLNEQVTPPKQTVRYRVSLHKDRSNGELYPAVSHGTGEENSTESCPEFVKWLTDWIEVEV